MIQGILFDKDGTLFDFNATWGAWSRHLLTDGILRVLPELDKDALIQRMNDAAAQVPQIEVTPLQPCLQALRDLGLQLGVATNDGEGPAMAHLEKAGVLDLFAFVAGSDSGYGGKPTTGQMKAFCAATGLKPENCVMVGDSLHDLDAGRAAGMKTVAVLTGPATRVDLAPFADVVLGSIAELAGWIKNTT